jgi:hypothetical protein
LRRIENLNSGNKPTLSLLTFQYFSDKGNVDKLVKFEQAMRPLHNHARAPGIYIKLMKEE